VIAGNDVSISIVFFYLNGRVEDAVIITPADPVDVSDGPFVAGRPYMAGKTILATCESPTMEIVNFLH
jgi:hypothetical protein